MSSSPLASPHLQCGAPGPGLILFELLHAYLHWMVSPHTFESVTLRHHDRAKWFVAWPSSRTSSLRKDLKEKIYIYTSSAGGHGNDGREHGACVAAHYTSNTNNASSPIVTGHRPWPLDLPTALYHHNMVVAPSISICYDSSSPNPCLIKFLVRRAQGRNAILRRHCKVVWHAG